MGVLIESAKVFQKRREQKRKNSWNILRVHGDKVLRRRPNVGGLGDYRDAKDILKADFQNICGYCGKDSGIMRERFHIDHFVLIKLDPERNEDYYNLVLSCPKCNLAKSSKWPTRDKNIVYDEREGFVALATEEYDQHIERNEAGYIQGKTLVGENMCKSLNFHIRKTDLYWKVSCLYHIQEELELLYDKKMLDENEKNYYIESNRLLKQYLDEAFSPGE